MLGTIERTYDGFNYGDGTANLTVTFRYRADSDGVAEVSPTVDDAVLYTADGEEIYGPHWYPDLQAAFETWFDGNNEEQVDVFDHCDDDARGRQEEAEAEAGYRRR